MPHLALSAFLQRVVNGGGQVHREFATGRGAMDLLVAYGPDRFGVELKRVRDRDGLETVVSNGVAQAILTLWGSTEDGSSCSTCARAARGTSGCGSARWSMRGGG